MSTTHALLRLGIVGLTGYGRTYFKTLAERTDATITAICDTNAEMVIVFSSADRETEGETPQ